MRISGDKMKAAAEMVKKFTAATPAEQKSKLTPLGRKETVNGMPTDVFTTDTSVGKATYYIAMNYPDAPAIMKEMKAAQPSAFANSGTSIPDFRDLPGVPVKIEMDTVRGRCRHYPCFGKTRSDSQQRICCSGELYRHENAGYFWWEKRRRRIRRRKCPPRRQWSPAPSVTP